MMWKLDKSPHDDITKWMTIFPQVPQVSQVCLTKLVINGSYEGFNRPSRDKNHVTKIYEIAGASDITSNENAGFSRSPLIVRGMIWPLLPKYKWGCTAKIDPYLPTLSGKCIATRTLETMTLLVTCSV